MFPVCVKQKERERGKGKREIKEKRIDENLVRDFEHLSLSENLLTLSILDFSKE